MKTLNILMMVIVAGVMVIGVSLVSFCSLAWAGPQNHFKGEKTNPINPGQEEKQRKDNTPTINPGIANCF